ncbi:unnamed protein product (macronuclear) [Paramecium tetraurelia]|uniref:Uncharacterized protein n=1 Tax=Paramecium tetraurelia TaxID=5888 RepID=A0EIH4_PARTE|nr:uncharacterized protein GSPATT00027444001 [Paramecium tetraurelia]CAK95115.1 unnamed protein product [Paramecium tetraurelia]|eukprot:XP_001462488.1 hypothetical protein (macronuclear) [Paramecium tetraurelia strain d4-2]
MNNQQQIIAVLTKIKESQQKIKVKTSKYLKQLDTFKMQLTSQEIRLYLVGNEQLPYGLLYCIGNKSKVDGSLRKSAYYSAELFLNILEKHPQRIEFIKVFADLEDDEYKLLSLSTHVLADKKLQDKGLIAFKIIKFLKDERPHFNLESILEIKKLKEQFDNWYKTVRIQQIQEHNKQTSWKESDQPPPENLNLQREQNKRQKKLEHITLQWDGNPEYLIKTFYNPFVPQQRTTKSNKNRSAALKKKQIAESLNAVIDVESVEQIKQQNKNLDKLIVKIHLDSPQFDAQTFLKIVQPQITKESMTMLQQQNIEMNKNIVYYFIDDFFCINQGILQIHNEFISKEFKDQIKRKKSLASNDKSGQPMQVDQILILGSLSKRTFQLLSKLNSISQSMNQLRMSQEKLKSVIDYIRKCEQYVQLPNQLKEAYLQRNNARVMKLISLQKENMNQYKNISLFKQLNEQINQVMKQIYNDMLQQIKQDNLDYNQILEIAEYINELNLTQNSTQDIVNNLQQSIKTSFNAYFNKTLQQRENEAYQVEMIRGDFIIEFLQQCSLPQKELQLQNCKALESFVSGKFSKQVKQFQNLCRDLNLNPNMQKLKEEIENKLLQFLDSTQKSWFSQQYSAILCQRINQDIESIKNMAQIIGNLFGETPKIDNSINDIEVQSLSLQFSNYTLKQVKPNFVVPQRDFFGVNFSEFILQIFNEILMISKNKNVDGQLFLQLVQDSLNYIQSSCKEAQDYLIFLHNIKLISSQIKELAQSVYSNSKKQKTFKEFAEPIQQQINGILSKYYQPCLQSYVKLLNLDQPQGMDMIPRPYVIQWLTVLNEQAVVLAQINLDQSVTDSIMSFIVSQCFKNIEAVSTHAKRAKFLDQLNHEINLIKIMTLTFQGSVSQEGFQRLQRKLEELSQNTLSDTSEWARTQKFKMSFNFKALYGYYQQQ